MMSLLFVAVLRNVFILSCVLIVCSLLFPVLWHLWIYAGSANSNFYYAITLTFNVGQVSETKYCVWLSIKHLFYISIKVLDILDIFESTLVLNIKTYIFGLSAFFYIQKKKIFP